jgi:putative oxidoreductase
MHVIQGFLTLVARLAIAAIFLSSAVMNKIPQFNTVVEVMDAKGIPQPKIMLAGAIAFLILGSLSLILGFWTRGGAFLLLVFLAAATYYFHAFWQLPADTPPETLRAEQIAFMKNLALMGGMLFIVANGGGPWSMDSRRRSGGSAADAGEEA